MLFVLLFPIVTIFFISQGLLSGFDTFPAILFGFVLVAFSALLGHIVAKAISDNLPTKLKRHCLDTLSLMDNGKFYDIQGGNVLYSTRDGNLIKFKTVSFQDVEIKLLSGGSYGFVETYVTEWKKSWFYWLAFNPKKNLKYVLTIHS